MLHPVGESDWFEKWRLKSDAAYNAQVISKLCQRFSIPDERLDEMAESLKLSGAIYLAQKRSARLPGILRERRMQIMRIQNLAADLSLELASLDPEAEALFWGQQRAAEMQAVLLVSTQARSTTKVEAFSSDAPSATTSEMPICRPDLTSSFGHTVRTSDSERGAAFSILDESMMRETLTILRNYGAAAMAEMARIPVQVGAPPREALHNWVWNIQALMTGLLKRRFTMTRENGGSPALLFCISAIEPLDETVGSESIANLMSDVIAETRRATRLRSKN